MAPQPFVLRDQDLLTQLVNRESGCTDKPDVEEGEEDVSLLAGRLSAAMAMRCVSKTKHVESGTHGVRETTVGKLRAAGFDVASTPYNSNPIHVSATRVGEWNSGAFSDCFTEVEWWIDE